MSAPQTDPEKQVRQHRTPIYGVVVLVILVLAGFFWWVAYETDDPEMPGQSTFEDNGGELLGPAGDTPAEPAPPAEPVPDQP